MLNIKLNYLTIFLFLVVSKITAIEQQNNLTNDDLPVDAINKFAMIYSIMKNNYYKPVDDEKLINGAISGMLNNMDSHSSFLNSIDLQKLHELTDGSYCGVGIVVSKDKPNEIEIVSAIYGSSAYQKGIKSGDKIIKIDGVNVSQLSIDQVSFMLRGKAGTKVKLEIAREQSLKPLEFILQRRELKIINLRYSFLDKDYVYLKIDTFQISTVEDLIKILTKIYAINRNIKGIIIDLRGNPGGVLQAAIGTVGAFIAENNLVVYTKSRNDTIGIKYLVTKSDYNLDNQKLDLNQIPLIYKNVPLVIIINQGTASASEIVSGALQDYKRATIVGEKSFGKGSVQTLIPINKDEAVKITTALYYTPKGRSIQAQGIVPDIIIHDEITDIEKSWNISESSLNHHVNNPSSDNVLSTNTGKVIYAPKQLTTRSEIEQKVKQNIDLYTDNKETIDIKPNEDFQLQCAIKILEHKPLPKSIKE